MKQNNKQISKEYEGFTYIFGIKQVKDEYVVYSKVEHNEYSKTNERFFDDYLYANEMYQDIVRNHEFDPMVVFASQLALEKHAGQLDKGGNPYVGHIFQVRDCLKTKEEKTVGVLHDIVEDTLMTLDDLKKLFPLEIVKAIDAVTRIKNEKFKESDENYFNRIIKNKIAINVKIQDLINNMDLFRLNKNIPSLEDANRQIKYANQLKFLLENL